MDVTFLGVSVALFLVILLAVNIDLWFYKLALLFIAGLFFFFFAPVIDLPLYFFGWFFILIVAYLGVIKIVEVLKLGK